MGYPPERRRLARRKLPQVVRLRPSDAHINFDEILPTLNATESLYFASKHGAYFVGMRVFIAFPYLVLSIANRSARWFASMLWGRAAAASPSQSSCPCTSAAKKPNARRLDD